MDREFWPVAVLGAANTWTQLSHGTDINSNTVILFVEIIIKYLLSTNWMLGMPLGRYTAVISLRSMGGITCLTTMLLSEI